MSLSQTRSEIIKQLFITKSQSIDKHSQYTQ